MSVLDFVVVNAVRSCSALPVPALPMGPQFKVASSLLLRIPLPIKGHELYQEDGNQEDAYLKEGMLALVSK